MTMNLNQLTIRNLFYHAGANLAVLLGVAVGTAVLTGALLVGDSLRYSLTRLTEERLGWVEQALVGSRLLPQSVADGVKAETVAPVLMLRGTATSVADRDRMARKVQILGVDARFWNGGGDTPFWNGSADKAVVNEAVARDLGLKVGDEVEVSLLHTSEVPRESPLGNRSPEASVGVATFTVERILPDDEFGAKFSLQPSLETVRSVFVPLAALQAALQQPGKINSLLLRGADLPPVSKGIAARLTLADLGLKLVRPEDRAGRLMKRLDTNKDGVLRGSEWFRRRGEEIVPRFARAIASAIPRPTPEVIDKKGLEEYFRRNPYVSLESKATLIDPVFQEAAVAAAHEASLTPAPTLVYLANTLAEGKTELPYLLVAGVDPSLPPLGKGVLPNGLPDDHILLVKWPGSPLSDKAGAKVTLTYYRPEQHDDEREDTAELTSVGSVDLKGALIDPDLTPEFPGVTDKDDIKSWDPPFKIDRSRVKPGDISERFWEDYRTTPRAYVNLATATRLFGSRFGNATSVRLFVPAVDETEALASFTSAFLRSLSLEKLGVVAQSVKADGLKSSGGAMNFAGLFLGFSFFLIAAALLLVGLLFRLNLERRAREIGLLATAGYRSAILRSLLLGEGAILAVVGAILGTLLALGYSRLLLQLMQTLWPGGMLHSFLRPSWTWLSLLIGFAGSVLVALGTIWWVVRGMAKVPPRLLIAGKTKDETDPTSLSRGPGSWQWYVTVGCIVLGLALLGVAFYVPGHEAQAGTFFGSGALFLTASMFLVSLWLRATSPAPLRPSGGLTQLALRNLARNSGRSLLTVGLLASAAFLLVAVESFRRSADPAGHGKDSPDGGFSLVGESELPIVRDLNTPDGRGEVLDALQVAWQKRQEPDITTLRADAEKLLQQVQVVPLRLREGDDASCLNLYQPRRPRILGVPETLIQRGGFVFGSSQAKTDEQRKNPWLLLNNPKADEPIPAFGENNTVEWMLQSSLGGQVETEDASGAKVKLRIAGLLQDSVFQSSLLISEPAFLRLYPDQEGYRFFLIACPGGSEERVKALLQSALAGRGLSIETASDRLNGYLAIENTYLSTFQALGGLGLILGSLGLAVVLLRGIWERQGELALLQALGYRHSHLMALILIENATLLLLGLVAGTVSAVLSIAPQILGHAATLPWRSLALLLGGVVLVGFVATLAATWAGLRRPLPPALRRE
jgi:ABC-type lipoprotein release transport system permease subunit